MTNNEELWTKYSNGDGTMDQVGFEDALTTQREELIKICRKIYIDGADWAEWGMNDRDAEIEFDEELEKAVALLQTKEETK